MLEAGPSQEERTLAGMSHMAILVGTAGMIAGFLVWSTQREKYRFAAFQGLQAAVYQVTVTIVSVVLWMGLVFLHIIPAAIREDGAARDVLSGISAAVTCLIIAFVAFTFVYGLWGGVQCFRGRDFRYVIIGGVLENRLGTDWKYSMPAPTGEETRAEEHDGFGFDEDSDEDSPEW